MIIIGLVIVIIALIAAISVLLIGNGGDASNDDNQIPEGMQRYNFDAGFTMLVKDDVKFLKTWDSSGLGISKNYYNKEDKYVIQFTETDMLKNSEDNYIKMFNSSDDFKISEEGDLKIVKVLDKSKKIAAGNSEKHFDYRVIVLHDNKVIILSGNNLDSLKEMANSINFDLGGSNE